MFDLEQFKQERKLQEPAENAKMVVVGILLISVIVFAIMGDDAVKPIIVNWAIFMGLLVIGCAIQDWTISRKIKELRSKRNG